MEVSVIRSSKVNIFKTDLVYRDIGFCSFKSNNNGDLLRKSGAFFGLSSRNEFGNNFSLKAVRSEAIKPHNVSSSSSSSRSQSHVGVKLYVGLPLDAVSDCNTVNHAKAIAAGLKALKLLGVDGVELPVWWGIAEKEAIRKYDWSGYLALVEMIQKVGLTVHVSFCFHASKESKIPLPEWVTRIGEQEPSIYFADRSGQQYKECLSLAVDGFPVLEGKTPVQVYRDFCESFKASFSPYLGTTISGISVGLGPDGELRYPSHQGLSKSKAPGAGEFQCYDKNMLMLLKEHAEANGNPNWGLGGPHDAPNYNEPPTSNGFFRDHGGSWESPYGDFFLSWYSSQLACHADQLLSLAAATFSDSKLPICGRIPLMHSWYKSRSHASELTAGYYNTGSKDGYERIADVFARNSCKMILPGMDLSDEHEPQLSHSSPELLLGQISAACRRHGVEISGQNSSVTGVVGGFEQIKKNLSGENKIDLFIYQRMGAYFFSPEHFPSFTQFVRSISQRELQSDDLPGEEEAEESMTVTSESGIQLQAA